MEGSGSAVDLSWIPLGAGASVPIVTWNGRLFERVAARRRHEPPRDLYHAALEVYLDGDRHAIEMAPAWGPGSGGGGVVATGPVGLRWLGRSRFFRYEVRCSRDGVIPDLGWAVGGARRVTEDPVAVRRLLGLVPQVPVATWGRDELRTGDMWNSNSLVAWLLARSGADLRRTTLPEGGRAPGWDAGLIVAAR